VIRDLSADVQLRASNISQLIHNKSSRDNIRSQNSVASKSIENKSQCSSHRISSFINVGNVVING